MCVSVSDRRVKVVKLTAGKEFPVHRLWYLVMSVFSFQGRRCLER